MPNLPAKTVVASCSCSDCGKPVQVVLNKNGNGYYFCPWTDESGERCNHQERWGKASSQQMQRDYLAHKEQPKEANKNERPSNLQEPQSGKQKRTPQGAATGKAFYE